MSKHLTLSDRAIIEKYLALDMSFSYIAKRLNRSATTISREVKNHRCFINGVRYTVNDCINYRSCLRRNLCDTESKYTCFGRCKTCTEYSCHNFCHDYISMHCELLDKFAIHADEIGLSEKTIYNYIDQSAFHIRNIDLPKKIRYRQRHPHEIVMKMDYQCRKGRTYTDFTSFMEQNPKLPIVEMDTVKSSRGSQKVLLTMIFRETNFMLIFLMPDGTQKSVNTVFDMLTLHLGLETFRKLFPVILTDNGAEFKGAHNIEFTENGARRTRLFYFDSQASWQKGRVEKNHVLIRQILPKGTNFNVLEDDDIHLIMCHINSVVRELFENQTPFDLMQKEEHKKLLDTLALQPIPLNEVRLKPALLKRKK